MKSRIRMGTLLFAFLALHGCGDSPSTVVGDATKSLRKVQAASQVGVTYDDYLKVVVEAKAKVDQAARLLPDSPLKDQINAAMDCYVDASLALQEKKLGSQYLDPRSGTGTVLIHRYQLDADSANPQTEIDLALKKIWEAAEEHLKQAERLA